MASTRLFRAFFSYAHEDAEAYPLLVAALTSELEQRVNVRLVSDRFEIWRDQEGIRTGDRWNRRIEAQLRASDILIVLLTPRWIGSAHCRQEYDLFEAVESERMVGDSVTGYVAPIVAREIERQRTSLSEEAACIYGRIMDRQGRPASPSLFLKRDHAGRDAILEQIADDIEGMILRCRGLAATIAPSDSATPRRRRDHDPTAHSFDEYDFVASAEVLINKDKGDGRRSLYAQVDFTERLYVEGGGARVEFGVRCAYWAFRNGGPGKLLQADELKNRPGRRNAYYLTRRSEPDTIVVCIEPEAGRSALAELALPPSASENRLAKVATAPFDVAIDQLTSQLEVKLGAEGLWIADGRGRAVSRRSAQWIEAIMTVAATRDMSVLTTGRLSRAVLIEERA
jgi:TIR domain-containing protein